MAKFTAFRGKLMMDNTDFNRSLQGSGKEVQKLHATTQREMRGVDETFKKSSKQVAVFQAAVVGGIAVSVNSLKDFERELLNIQYTLEDTTGVVRREFQAMAAEAAKTTGASGTLITGVQQVLVGSGYSTAETERLTTKLGNLIDATGRTDSKLAESLVSGAITTKRDIEELANIYTGASRTARGGTKGGLDFISQFMPTLAPSASALDLTAEDTAALLSTATWHTRTTRQAGSGLRMIMEEIVKPDSRFAKNFEETFGESFEEATKGKGVQGIINAFEKAIGRWGEKGFISSFGSAETGGLALAVTKDSARLEEAIASAYDSDAVAKVIEGYEGTINQVSGVLTETAEDFRRQIGFAFEDDVKDWMRTFTEILDNDKLLDAAIDFLDAATILSDPMRDVAVPLAEFAAALATFEIPTPGGGLSLIELATYGWLGSRFGRMGMGGGRIAGAATKGIKVGGKGGMAFGGLSGAAGTAVSVGSRALGWAGLGLLANQVVEATTGFDALGTAIESLTDIVEDAEGVWASVRGDVDSGGRASAYAQAVVPPGVRDINDSANAIMNVLDESGPGKRVTLTDNSEWEQSMKAGRAEMRRAISDIVGGQQETLQDFSNYQLGGILSGFTADMQLLSQRGEERLAQWQQEREDKLIREQNLMEGFRMIDASLTYIGTQAAGINENTDPTNPDNCATGTISGSYGTMNVLETVG